jgi:anti-anti-sigma regulatory factor
MLKLEGALRDAWVDELRNVVANDGAAPIEIDLSQVNFIDDAGVALLHELLAAGAKITACSGFVAACLEME